MDKTNNVFHDHGNPINVNFFSTIKYVHSRAIFVHDKNKNRIYFINTINLKKGRENDK